MTTQLRRRGAAAMLATGLAGAALALPAPAYAAGWTNALRWGGAVTQACRQPVDDGRVRVKVRLDNSGGNQRATGGLNTVQGNGNPGNDWTYTKPTSPGDVSDPVSRVFAADDAVWLIIGSNVGITGERAMKVAGLKKCPSVA